ncbi:hypothetical protein EV128_11050 [Rhizobium azibense]|nr:hypothetical protein EV128_11050 [Rhizobium azibense]
MAIVLSDDDLDRSTTMPIAIKAIEEQWQRDQQGY